MFKVLYEDNHLLGVEKPVNVPVMADDSGDEDLQSMGKQYLKEKYGKPGSVYLGLVHRLDRPVGGAMIFARTSKAASRLSEAIRTHQVRKIYYAVTQGVPAQKSGTLVDYLIKDREKNMVTVTDEKHGDRCELSYEVLQEKDGLALVEIELGTGRSHQIRVQFASRGLPLVNDQRYNKNADGRGQIALWSHILSFPHPVSKETVVLKSLPPREYPWNRFEVR